ncbi:MAG TPA: RNA polymerase sigma factor [Vicinamibacterales bacterium]|nr:RNA polymerase sigma factor [Vicinamibacterales bacterium]
MLAAELTDADLAERCRARDEVAVRELTRRYNQRLYRVARGIVRDDAEAEGVVQDTYVRALTGLERFRGDSALGTWLTRIAMNEALGRVRRRRPVQMEAGSAPAILAEPVSTTPDPEIQMATTESRAMLEEAIDQLPDDFRTIFIARIVEGLSTEETAELFGLRPETVKTRVHRARAKLRASLEARLGPAVREAFAFDGARCDRLTNAVLARLGNL